MLGFKLSSLRPLRPGLQRNVLDHQEEVEFSRELGYRSTADGHRDRVQPELESWPIPGGAAQLGLGPACPFDGERLVHATRQPLFSAAVCRAVRREAARHIGSGGSSSFTMTDTNRDADVHSLPRTQRWLNAALAARLFPLVGRCFGAAAEPHSRLFVYRSLVVQYDAAAQLTHQPTHRDGALVSVIVPLNPPSEYAGGGTHIEALGEALVLAQGHALLHPSSLRHAAQRITAGERWVLVVFLGHQRMRFAEHGRRFKARSTEHAAEEEEDDDDDDENENANYDDSLQAELRLLRQALVVCPDDSELWYDLGGCLHDLGELEEAARHYITSIELNEHDPNPHNNLGALLLPSSPRAALSCFRRAMSLDPHHANAYSNAAGLLLGLGRLRAARTLLRAAPPAVQSDAEVASLMRAAGCTDEGHAT